jgi:hypothetical protein
MTGRVNAGACDRDLTFVFEERRNLATREGSTQTNLYFDSSATQPNVQSTRVRTLHSSGAQPKLFGYQLPGD